MNNDLFDIQRVAWMFEFELAGDLLTGIKLIVFIKFVDSNNVDDPEIAMQTTKLFKIQRCPFNQRIFIKKAGVYFL